MMTRFAKRKLLKAKITLNQTIQRILDINRRRKKLSFHSDPLSREEELNEELKVLNEIAKQQARIVRHYESNLEPQKVMAR